MSNCIIILSIWSNKIAFICFYYLIIVFFTYSLNKSMGSETRFRDLRLHFLTYNDESIIFELILLQMIYMHHLHEWKMRKKHITTWICRFCKWIYDNCKVIHANIIFIAVSNKLLWKLFLVLSLTWDTKVSLSFK